VALKLFIRNKKQAYWSQTPQNVQRLSGKHHGDKTF